MKRLVLGGIAGVLYPVTRVLASVTGPTDRLPDYPRFDLGPHTLTSRVIEGLSLACLLLFVVTLPALAERLGRLYGERRAATVPVVLLSVWAVVRFAASFADPYLELTVVAASAFLLGLAVLWTVKLAGQTHPLAGYVGLATALFSFLAGATVLFPLEVSDARSLGLGLIYRDPGPFNPGGMVYVAAFGLWSCWVAGMGVAMLRRA